MQKLILLISLTTQAIVISSAPATVPPLQQAIEKGDVGEIKKLIANGANVNAFNATNRTPLMNAVESVQLKALQALLAQPGIDVNLRDPSGYSALDLAILQSKPKAAELLFKDPRLKATYDDLRLALFDKKKWAIKLFLNDPRQSVFKDAIVNNYAAVDQMIDAGADVNAPDKKSGDLPLMTAIAGRGYRNGALRSLLSNPRIDVNKRDKEGFSPLAQAVRNWNGRAVDWLLADPRLNPNLRDKSGLTPLGQAIKGTILWAVGKIAVDPRVDKKGLFSEKPRLTYIEAAKKYQAEATDETVKSHAGSILAFLTQNKYN